MAPNTAETAKPVKPFAEMTEVELEEFDREFVAALEAGDGSAAEASLAAGVPIYYSEEELPSPFVIKEYPDGRKEIVYFVNGVETVLNAIV